MKKKVIVACGGAVATSTIAANRIETLCRENHIDVEICQIRISEIESHLSGASLLVATTKIKRDYGIPYVPGMAFISGIGESQTEEAVLTVLRG